MAETTGIEWTDHTWSPWRGCTPVSAACDFCYAAALSKRCGGPRYEAGAPRVRTSAEYWKLPLRWNRRAAASGQRETVFPSLVDPFDTEVPDAWRVDHFDVIGRTPWLDWLLLTKRPQVAKKWAEAHPLPDNVWLGVTAETQAMADLRIPVLLSIEARVRFLSCEPLLGPVDVTAIRRTRADGFMRPLDGRFNRIDWVIAGGESGPKARPSHPDWFRSLRDQCADAGVPFFFKQWGEFRPSLDDKVEIVDTSEAGVYWPDGTIGRGRDSEKGGPGKNLYRVGKKAAGAMLDGREWREVPR